MGRDNWYFPADWHRCLNANLFDSVMNLQSTPQTTGYCPYQVIGETRPARWLVTCDHAANTIPPFIPGQTLGIAAEDMARHIAYDPGAAGVSLHLAELLNGPVVLSNFSRLVIDPNRGEDDPTLVMRLYDGTIVPGNARLTPDEHEMRLNHCYRPYHDALTRQAARHPEAVILAIHSYAPQLRGRPPRPWHIGILHAEDDRLSRPLIDRLKAEPDLCVGENEPYGGHLPGDSIDRHAIAAGRMNTLIELRNDLIATPAQQKAWAERLAPILTETLTATGQ